MTGQSALSIARGAVREGLAAVEGFGDLLGSRRVGPRALERVRADLGDACASLRSALGMLEAALGEAFGEDEAATASTRVLCAHASARAEALSGVLASAAPLSDARRRLSTEAAVRRVGVELRDAVALCDLLAAAAAPAPTELDLCDVLDQRFGGKTRAERTVRLGVDATRPAPLMSDLHVIGGLLEAAVAVVARAGVTSPRLGVVKWRDGSMQVRIGPTPRGSAPARSTVEVPLREDIPGAFEAAQVAARRVGGKLEADAATHVVTIAVGADPARAKAGLDDPR